MITLTKEEFKEFRQLCFHMHVYKFNWYGRWKSVYRCKKSKKELPCTLHNCPVCVLKEGDKHE